MFKTGLLHLRNQKKRKDLIYNVLKLVSFHFSVFLSSLLQKSGLSRLWFLYSPICRVVVLL